ncbi:Alg9-like mannosyltransferase family-domain-containing protein [Phaeosphaeria sp. MPI-PUGE-AT-0046c]|nr:Alg9-like mannosyltransferase family-domain-containing protein [Phaeosphaeria sp. MPI-PUGE-AT-0046c]
MRPSGAPPTRPPNSYRDSALAIFALLLAFRIVNALTLRTFFQPDEFFQSLEPAWQLAFGGTSRAWITWEWRTHLRSSLHPALFAAVYRLAAHLADLCGLTLPARAHLLLVAPKVTQAVFAALLDCYTWKLAEKAYGRGSRTALATLALSVCSPWQWFCSTRTLSNCVEATITTIAIYHWPWHWPGPAGDSKKVHKDQLQNVEQHLGLTSEVRLSLLLAALACVLRPTNALIWLAVSVPTFWQATKWLRSAVLACSLASDRLYYGVWTLPPLRFLYFNIAQSLAVFYGKNRTDYYITEGLPLLLTTALPFAVGGLITALRGNELRHSPTTGNHDVRSPAPELVHDAAQRRVLIRQAWTCVVTTLALSLISHKEVRFLYPLLPFLHVLAAGPLSIFSPAGGKLDRKFVVVALLASNVVIGGYVSTVHQRGVIDVLAYIRHKHEARNSLQSLVQLPSHGVSNTTVAFLMPCHSTPWRSHLIYPEIDAWALTCEPPIDVPLTERSIYLDEADEFYIKPGPVSWLRGNMESIDTIKTGGSRSGRHWMQQDPKFKAKYRRAWPQNLVFFGQLEETLKEVLEDTRYQECWRGFNSHFHDDWRRKGDVVVWCLDGM